MSLTGAQSTSVFVQFHNDGVTHVAVNGYPAVVVQNSSTQQPVFGSVTVTPDELRSLQDTINGNSHEELKAVVEQLCQSIPGVKEFIKSSSTVARQNQNQMSLQPEPSGQHQSHNHNQLVSTDSPPPLNPSIAIFDSRIGTANAMAMAPSVGTAQRPAMPPLHPASTSTVAPPQSRALDPAAGPPTYNLYVAHSIEEIWQEWTVGMDGWPALKKLEEKWGPQLRPTNRQRAAWCRRKVIVDELRARIRRRIAVAPMGETEKQSERVVIEGLEEERAGRSMFALIKEMQDKRRASRRGDMEGASPE